MIPARLPAVGYSTNPLFVLGAADMHPARVGATVESLKPQNVRGDLRCYLNNEPLYPITQRQFAHSVRLVGAGRAADARSYLVRAMRECANWKRTTLHAGDVLTWHEVTASGRDIISAVIVVAAVVYGIETQDWATAAKWAAFAFAVENVLIPPTPRTNQSTAAENTYNTSLNGNTARLDQPIWKVCGLTKITPPFAAQPYYEYLGVADAQFSFDGVPAETFISGPGVVNAQFYFAVFAIGVGNHDLLAAFIGLTQIGNFQDVIVQKYLPPGTQPTTALCNVVTSTEVTTLVLDSAKYVGPYVVCQPQRKAAFIGIDTAAPQGLGLGGTDGPDGNLELAWKVYGREIDDFGRPITPWRELLNTGKLDNTNTPLRWSDKIAIVPPARMEVRLIRLDIKNTTSAARHELNWIGLRAYLDEPATLNPDTAHYEVVMRASEQLNLNAQRDFSVIVAARVRTWAPETGWGPEVATRNPAWWLAALWTSPIWGEGLPDDRIDLAALYAWAQECDARQDRVDYAFTSSVNAWDAAQTIARAGRARCFRRFGINTLVRDSIVTLPTTAFTYRNTVAKSMALSESLPGRDAADGYVIQYTSNVSWDTATIECPCPGVSVTDPTSPRYHAGLPPMAKPIYRTLDGIQGATHAEREGLYEAAVLLWRRRTVKCKTEMQGVVCAYGDSARWMPEVAGYGQSGDVVAWNDETLTMTLSEPASFVIDPSLPLLPITTFSWDGVPTETFVSGPAPMINLRLIRDDGSLTDPVIVSPGPEPTKIILPARPDFDIVTDDGTRERPKFLLGVLDVGDELVKVTSIADGGKSNAESGMDGAQLYDVSGVVDDDRVHLVDVFLLPGPGDIQDPIVIPTAEPDPGGGGDILYVINLYDERMNSIGTAEGGWNANAAINFSNTGQAYPTGIDFYPVVVYLGQWSHYALEPTQAALYEVRATLLSRVVSPAQATWVGPGTGDYVYTPRVLGLEALPTFNPGSDVLDTWLSLSTSRHWECDLPAGAAIDAGVNATTTRIFIEIRQVSTGVVQASATYTISLKGYPL